MELVKLSKYWSKHSENIGPIHEYLLVGITHMQKKKECKNKNIEEGCKGQQISLD